MDDLKIIVANGDSVDPASLADVLNANLVYLCKSNAGTSNDIVDCYGIGMDPRSFFEETLIIKTISPILQESYAPSTNRRRNYICCRQYHWKS